ncbi:MAG: leucine-rich repeat protein [Clostridia bacterium]|nr:leucine-rich repeat protein [Clostridia bacterium]
MKRIVSLILCLALTAALLPAAAMAEDGTCGDSHSWVEATCVTPMTCTVCGATQGDVAEHTNHTGLTELTGSSEELFSEVLRSGNYYLGEDITLDFEHYIELFDEVNICLNGHKLMLDATGWGDAPVFFVSGTLRVYDCGDTLRTYTADENGLWVPAENGEHATFGGVICGGTGDNYTYSGNHGGMTSSDTAQGGAVFCLGRFELHGGNIVGNSADYGAGVYVGGGSFLMTNGRIVGNSATDGEGGGVYVDRARFTMTAGSIDSNRANRGSAIYQSGTGTVEISGCVINENTAQDKGAVYIQDSMSVSGETCIMENFSGTGVAPNLYLASGVCVDVSGGLDEYAEICVYAEDVGEPFTVGGSVTYLDNFKSDRDGYRVAALEETELALVEKSVCLVHTPGETVTENEVPSTCTVAGTYDSVVYCTSCGDELSRETMSLSLAKHRWGAVTAAFKRTCGVCGTTEEVDSISGETDDELEWVLTKDGVLTVSGEGECTDLEEMEEYDVKTVIVEEGITALSSRAIKMLPNVTSLSLPKSMEDLDADAINRYMEHISKITVAEGNKHYTVWERMLFDYDMTELLCAPRCGIDETVTVPEGVRFINGYAFANSWVTELSLPISLKTVSTYAFDGCDDLETVAYPGTKAAWTAMVTVKAYNTALEDADFTYGTVDSFSGTCGDDAAWVLTLSDGVLTISGTGTVDDQGWPRSVVEKAVLQEGITAIEEEVFYKHTALTELTLPKSLTFIGESNFDGGSLDTVTYNGSEPQWGLVSVSDDNDDLLEADMLFDSRLMVEWNAPHTVLSISGMIRDSAWVTAAFYDAEGRMTLLKHYVAADIKNGVGIYSESVDLTVCSAKVMILDEHYAPMGLPYVLAGGAGGSGDTVTAWLYATDKAYIDGKKKAASGTLLFSDGSNTYEMEAGKGTPGTWELGQAFDLTLDAEGRVIDAELSGKSEVGECFLLHVNQDEGKTGTVFEFGELSGSFADDEIPCLVLEPGGNGVPEDMEADTMADMAETRVSHLYRGIDKDGDGEIDYLLVKPTLYGRVYKAAKNYVMLEDNQGEKMTETVSGDTEWYLEDTLDIEDLPPVGSILKLTWNIDTGLYEVEELKEQQGELMSLGSRNLKFDFGVAYVADDGWVDVDDMDEEIIYKVLMDEKLLVWAEAEQTESEQPDEPAVLFTHGWLYVTEWVQTTKYGDIYRVVFENGENGEILLTDTPVTDVLYAYTCDEATNQYTLTLVEPGTQDGEIVDLHNDRGVELEDADEKYLSMKGVTVALMKVTVMDGEAYSRTIAFYDPDDLNDPDISNDREGKSWIQYTDYCYVEGELLYVVAYQIDEDDLADDPKLPDKLEELFRQMVGLSE